MEKTWNIQGGCIVSVSVCNCLLQTVLHLYCIPFQTGCFIGLSIMSYNNPCSINKSSGIALSMIQTTMFFAAHLFYNFC